MTSVSKAMWLSMMGKVTTNLVVLLPNVRARSPAFTDVLVWGPGTAEIKW